MRKKLRIDFFFKPAPTSKQHISALRASILKNLVSFGKNFQFPAIRVLLEVDCSNSLEVISQWTSIDKLKKDCAQGLDGTHTRLLCKPLPVYASANASCDPSSGRAY